jgi:hypothetical protein
VGKVVHPLQSVNCHDSRAHGHKRPGPFARLVGVWLGRFRLGLFHVMQQVRSLCVCFGYKWDACERSSFFTIGVTPMSLMPLITMGNLGTSSCLDIV